MPTWPSPSAPAPCQPASALHTFEGRPQKHPCHPAFTLALTWTRNGRTELHDSGLGHLWCYPRTRVQPPQGQRRTPFPPLSLPRCLCTGSMHPPSLHLTLPHGKGCQSSCPGSLGQVQPRPPTEDKPHLWCCTEPSLYAASAVWATWNLSVLFPPAYRLISSPQSNWTARVTGEGTKSAFVLPLHPSSFPPPNLLPPVNQSKVTEVESQVKEQKIGNVEKACHKMRLLIPSWGSRVIIHTLHRRIETIGLLTQSQTLMRRISYTPTATWRKKE